MKNMDNLDFYPKKILVGVDGSEYSMKATDLGILLAKKYDAHLYLVHVIDFPGYLTLSDPVYEQDRRIYNKFLKIESKKKGGRITFKSFLSRLERECRVRSSSNR